MSTDVLGRQRTPLSFCAVLNFMILLSSTGSFGDTKILERYQEQLNKLEKLHFDGKPAKIKRYRCVEEYVYLDEKGNIIATEVTSSTQPLPLYEPFGETTGSPSSTIPRATQPKTMESLPPLKTKYSVEESMLERATSMLTTTTELPLLKPPAIDTTTQQMPFLPPPNSTSVATESSTLGKPYNPAGLTIRRIRPHNSAPPTEKSRSESRNVVHSGSDRSADRLSVGGSQSPSSPLFTPQKEIRRSYEFRAEKGEKPTKYNTDREYGDYHYYEDDHEYPLHRPELRRHSAYTKKAYMEDLDDDDYYWESKKSRLPHRSFARTTMRYPLSSRQRPISMVEESGSAEMEEGSLIKPGPPKAIRPQHRIRQNGFTLPQTSARHAQQRAQKFWAPPIPYERVAEGSVLDSSTGPSEEVTQPTYKPAIPQREQQRIGSFVQSLDDQRSAAHPRFIPTPPTPVPASTPDPLQMTPENCAKVMSYAKLFGVPNPQAWVHDNCAFVQTFVQAPCNDINKFVDSCFKRKFL